MHVVYLDIYVHCMLFSPEVLTGPKKSPQDTDEHRGYVRDLCNLSCSKKEGRKELLTRKTDIGPTVRGDSVVTSPSGLVRGLLRFE